MYIKLEARAVSRALAGGLILGASVGFVLGGAYLLGATERAADSDAQVHRLAAAASDGFSEDALRVEAGGMGPGALALARRHDPFTPAAFVGDAPRAGSDAEVASLFPKRGAMPSTVGQAGANPLLMRASYTAPVAPARPFHFASGDALQSARDLECLTDAVYYEARGESAAGQAAVAQVVLNRVRHPAFPKSVCGVVFQGAYTGDTCQFSFACDGSMRRRREQQAWNRAERVAARALEGFVMPSVGNATHFHVVGLEPGWGPRLLRVAQIGLHVFYRFGGYIGGSANFNGRVQHSGAQIADANTAPLAGVSADGRPMGQIILASAVAAGPIPAPVAAPATPASASVAAPKAVAPATSAPDAALKPEPVAKAKIETSDKTAT